MADQVAVLSKRPTTIKEIHDINLTINDEKNPLSARKAPEFKDYFDLLWKELDIYEKI